MTDRQPEASDDEREAALRRLAELLASVIKREVDAELKLKASRRTVKSV